VRARLDAVNRMAFVHHKRITCVNVATESVLFELIFGS
jgi:hypothetical protein